jgi:hypothetical protein
MRRIITLHLLSLALIMANKKIGVNKGEEERTPTLQSRLSFFTENPRRGVLGNPPSPGPIGQGFSKGVCIPTDSLRRP